MSRRATALATILALAVAAAGPALPAAAATYTLDRTLRDSRIVESSGLARSTWSTSVLWTHNDNGDSERIFAVGADGATRATYTLAGATATDWEDIAAGPDHTLWVGDIGDNGRSRATIQVYRVTEPATLADGSLTATRYTLAYPDGAHDAEALMVDPVTGRVYVVSKVSSGGAVYAAPSTLSPTGTNTLTRVASAPATVTGGAFGSGGRYALVTYDTLYLYPSLGADPTTSALAALQQCESVEVGADGATVYLGSEGTSSPVYRTTWPAAEPGDAGTLSLSPGGTASVTAATAFTDGVAATSFSLPRLSDLGAGAYTGLLVRGSGSQSGYRVQARVAGDGSIALSVRRTVAGTDTVLATVAVPTRVTAGTRYRMEARIGGSTSVTVRARVYPDGAAVPTWQATVTDTSSARITTAAAPRIWAYLSGSAASSLPVSYTRTSVVRNA